MFASILGYTFLAACTVVGALVFPDDLIRTPAWFFMFLMLAASARFSWSLPKAPSDVKAWLFYSVAAVAGGLVFGVLDLVLVGGERSWLYLDGAVAVGGFLVALAGAVRCAALGNSTRV